MILLKQFPLVIHLHFILVSLFISNSETWELCTSPSIWYQTVAISQKVQVEVQTISEQIFRLRPRPSSLVFDLEEETPVVPIVNW